MIIKWYVIQVIRDNIDKHYGNNWFIKDVDSDDYDDDISAYYYFYSL